MFGGRKVPFEDIMKHDTTIEVPVGRFIRCERGNFGDAHTIVAIDRDIVRKDGALVQLLAEIELLLLDCIRLSQGFIHNEQTKLVLLA